MPFKSEKQRRFLWAEHPDIAKRWAHEYPNQKKLPMYAHNSDTSDSKEKEPESKEKTTKVSYTMLPTNTPDDISISDMLRLCVNKRVNNMLNISQSDSRDTSKTADSKQEIIDIPHSSKPVYAGEERNDGTITGHIPDGKNISGTNSTGVAKGEQGSNNAINELLTKLSVVLSPHIEQTMENMKAEREGRVARRIPRNRGVKQYPVATPSIPLPMGMQQQQPQQAQNQQQLRPVGGGSHPQFNPINAFGAISSTGEINGNAAFGAKNSPDSSKIAAIIKRATRSDALCKLMSLENVDPADVDYYVEEFEEELAGRKAAASTPAWQRAEGKNDAGGLNAKGRASYNKATGGHLKAPVTESSPKGSRAKRQNSFCARMCGMKRVNTGAGTAKDPDSRINKSLRKWNCKCSSAMEFGEKMAVNPATFMGKNDPHAAMRNLISPQQTQAYKQRVNTGTLAMNKLMGRPQPQPATQPQTLTKTLGQAPSQVNNQPAGGNPQYAKFVQTPPQSLAQRAANGVPQVSASMFGTRRGNMATQAAAGAAGGLLNAATGGVAKPLMGAIGAGATLASAARRSNPVQGPQTSARQVSTAQPQPNLARRVSALPNNMQSALLGGHTGAATTQMNQNLQQPQTAMTKTVAPGKPQGFLQRLFQNADAF